MSERGVIRFAALAAGFSAFLSFSWVLGADEAAEYAAFLDEYRAQENQFFKACTIAGTITDTRITLSNPQQPKFDEARYSFRLIGSEGRWAWTMRLEGPLANRERDARPRIATEEETSVLITSAIHAKQTLTTPRDHRGACYMFRAPDDPDQSMARMATDMLLVAGRGFSRFLTEITSLERRDDGVIEVGGDGRYHDLADGRFRLVIDVRAGFVVKEGYFVAENGAVTHFGGQRDQTDTPQPFVRPAKAATGYAREGIATSVEATADAEHYATIARKLLTRSEPDRSEIDARGMGPWIFRVYKDGRLEHEQPIDGSPVRRKRTK